MRACTLAFALAMLVAAPTQAAQPTRIAASALTQAASLREAALHDPTAWKVLESLTTEVGPRMAGSEGDARAVAWAQAKFRELGYDKVWTEAVTFPKWERRGEHAQLLGAHAQPLLVTALGGSPGGTVEGEVVRFDSVEALQAAPAGALAGKIAFVDMPMAPAPELSTMSGGLPATNRGWSSWAICVDGETLTVTPGHFLVSWVPAKST